MKTQVTNVLSWTSLLLPALVCGQSTYERTVEISYARTHAKSFTFSDETLFQAFDQVSPPITAVIPFLLDVTDASVYDSTLQMLAQRNITMVPAIGSASQPKLNCKLYKDTAASYRNYTDSIRLELLDIYVKTNDDIKQIQSLANYLSDNLGFKHIMLNPWPKMPGTKDFVVFDNPAVDSTILSVLLDFDRSPPFTVHPDPTNWFPAKPKRIDQLRQANPNMEVLVNYENEPQMEALAGLPIDQQEQAMLTTINQINKQNDGLFWTAPFSQDYNPIAIGTWDWIAQQLSKL